ncbi:MAG: nucleotidyltransferase family protein [Alkalispirochaeta sp.]
MSRVTRGDDLQAIIDRSRRLKAAANARAARRRDHALQVAKDLAAEMGKQDRSVKRVILFGSLLPGRAFRGESDIDLAIDGGDMPLLERIALDADVSVDMIGLDDARPGIRERIPEEGMVLYER